ncbi:radial spoke head protein 4 homolog A-like [Eupeodes corollae]|uniref:radial spoke head protein 4 homolog A-like n=1 Tax=Eupeodes corollae TaxID=290404 RepID=UPI002493CE0C|nr:radial spoke head protein 4 homolog A-like [Eupeodes corollae]
MPDSCVSSNEYPSILTSDNSKINANCRCVSRDSSSENSSEFQFPRSEKKHYLNYEKFKAILQQSSTKSGDNLYDHLVAIIKRIIDERPINVIDYFEQFSRNVRITTLHGLDYLEKPQFIKLAKSVIEFMKIKDSKDSISYLEEFEDIAESEMTMYQSSDSIQQFLKIQRSLLDCENVLQIQQFFAFCGLGFDIDEVFQLALSVQKVQQLPYVKNARFWGRIFGLRASYFVVEAELTRTEIQNRLKAMKSRLLDEMKSFITERERDQTKSFSDEELIPGSKWKEVLTEEELKKMQHPIEPIPRLYFQKFFNELKEPVGSGLNRKTYFVTTSLSTDWQELPSVAPSHIKTSKIIKKYFTGDLNLNLRPSFPGSEKHYLRAMIARISAGSLIAPKGFYRRLTRRERRMMEENYDLGEEEFDSDEEDDDIGNDDLITQNYDYEQLSLEELTLLTNWVHFRPNILNQGRIVHMNEKLAIKDLEKEVILSMKNGNDSAWEDNEENELEEEENQEEEDQGEDILPEETGPELFSSCDEDQNNEAIPSWTFRYSSVYNKLNQMIIMRSNLWPGAYSIAFENVSDCIYLGWGFKYIPRCTSLQQLPIIQDFDFRDDAKEENDPSVEMEEKWRAYHMKKILSKHNYEEMSDVSAEVDFDDDEV